MMAVTRDSATASGARAERPPASCRLHHHRRGDRGYDSPLARSGSVGGARRRAEQGATVVEYALVLALVVVVASFGIDKYANFRRDETTRKTDESMACAPGEQTRLAGAPDLTECSVPATTSPSTSSTTTPPGPDPTPDPGLTPVVVDTPVPSVTTSGGNKWNVTVKVQVRNPVTGAPYGPSVTVTAAWSGGGGGTTCTTGVDGSCSLSLTGINHGTKEVSFVVVSVAGPGIVPPTSYPAAITIAQPA